MTVRMQSGVVMVAVMVGFSNSARAQNGVMEFYNSFDPNRPTIIGVHGWFGSISNADTFGRSPTFAQRANCIGWDWDATFIRDIIPNAERSGRQLAEEFAAYIRTQHPGYNQPIQLVGHSLGTHVVLECAAHLRDLGRTDPNFEEYQADQVTLVDTGFGGAPIQQKIDEIQSDYLVPLKMDNYWSPSSAGGTGQAYLGPFPDIQIPVSHINLWYWYWTSLDQTPVGPLDPGATYGQAGALADLDVGAATVTMISGQGTPLIVSDDRFRATR